MPVYQKYLSKDQITDFEFVLSLIRAEINNEQANKIRLFLETTPVDWKFVLNLVAKHRVLPIFYANIKKIGLQSFLPAFARQQLSHQYLEIISYNLRLRKKLTTILALLENRNIPAVPFKGPILAHELYGDSALRYYQDMDILVPKNCVLSAREALLEAGFYSPVKRFSGKGFGQALKYGRECDFLDPSDNFKIDLHWHLSGPFRVAFDYDFCQARLRKIRLNGQAVYSLSEEDTLLHLCMNGTHDIWDNLEKMVCVADFIDRHPHLDWDLVQKLAVALHCRRMLFLGLFLAQDVFHAPLPPEIVSQMGKNKVIQKIADKIHARNFYGTAQKTPIEKRIAEIPYYLMVREHATDKLLYLFRRIFIPTQKDFKNRSLNSGFSFFYFISRPIDLMVEVLRSLRY